jgi:hypothetical protein
MKIAFLTPSVSRAIGGIFEAERRMQQSLQGQAGLDVQVIGFPIAAAARRIWFKKA